MLNKGLYLSRDGRWFDHGEEITHKRTIELFFRSIQRIGSHYAVTSERETVPLVVEETAYFITRIDTSGAKWQASLSDGTTESLDPTTMQLSPAGGLLFKIKTCAEQALTLKPAYDSLASFFDTRGDYAGCVINGVFYPLQNVGPSLHTDVTDVLNQPAKSVSTRAARHKSRKGTRGPSKPKQKSVKKSQTRTNRPDKKSSLTKNRRPPKKMAIRKRRR